jgi:hypothetical protein
MSIISHPYICWQCAKLSTFATGPHLQSYFTGGWGLTCIVIYLSLWYSISSQQNMDCIQQLCSSGRYSMTFAAFRHVRLSPWAIRVDSPAFFSYVTPTSTYKLCKEPSKAQIKKTFPILLSTTLFNLSETLSYFQRQSFYHFLDPIILAVWQFTHIQDLVH